jgi:hypothetical protein
MNYKLLYQWTNELARGLGCLNSWQVESVGLFSYGVIRAGSCQQQSVARQVSCGEQVESTARRWRRLLSNETFPLELFFGAWTKWVISRLGEKRITLLVDETKIADRMAVMMVGVAWEGRCIPLAWRAYGANSAVAYPAEGQVGMIKKLLEQVKSGLPSPVEVLVEADRGIGTSPELCRAVDGLGWHYLFRVTCQSKIVTDSGEYTIAQQVQPGHIWQASGRVFKKRGHIPAHARAIWSAGYEQPWALVTNDPTLTGYEYARRNWQEQGFRDLKSGGWQWGHSLIRLPGHMDRLLVLLAIAYAWTIAWGSQAIATHRAQPLLRRPDHACRRLWSLFKEGLRYFVEVIQRSLACLRFSFIPDHRFT